MKILVDLGYYESELVEFDIPRFMLRGFRKVVKDCVSWGEFESKYPKKNVNKYLKSLLIATHDLDYYKKAWDKNQEWKKLESLKPKLAVSFSGTVWTNYMDVMDRDEYAKYMTKEDRKIERLNNKINDLLKGLQIYEKDN